LTGISEILVLLLLITGILILPRLFKKEPVKKVSSSKKNKKLTAKTRFAIVLSVIYPLAVALYLTPWHENQILYVCSGVLPVLLAWAIAWIIAGQKK